MKQTPIWILASHEQLILLNDLSQSLSYAYSYHRSNPRVSSLREIYYILIKTPYSSLRIKHTLFYIFQRRILQSHFTGIFDEKSARCKRKTKFSFLKKKKRTTTNSSFLPFWSLLAQIEKEQQRRIFWKSNKKNGNPNKIQKHWAEIEARKPESNEENLQ